MLNKAFFKRIVPFVLAIALGLFVASFFVNIAPEFKFRRDRFRRCRETQMLRYENERLRFENQQLQEKINSSERMVLLDEPPPPLPPRVITMPMDSVPAAPVAPRVK